MPDINGMGDAMPYAWTGGAGLLGRLMYHARQVQDGKRKPWSWALILDLPIALGMGWTVYGLCVWLDLALQLRSRPSTMPSGELPSPQAGATRATPSPHRPSDCIK